ncbi:MAG TPA: anibiotic ABC transporter, partial [Variovorax sp.]|nr:anibiotic ABC transporter [Variovorax sp.]
MEASLFRKEVLEAHVDSPGSIALTTPLRTSLLIAAAVGAAMLVVAFLILAPYTRRASVTGQLVPTRGLVSVVAPTRGVLAELATEEGARVRAGQVLAQVRVPLVVTGGDD